MTTYLNRVAVAAPRNGTTDHTVGPDGTGGSVVSGVAFTPTAGSLLICVVEGSVTSVTSTTGWSQVAGGSAVGNTGLYLFTRTATGSDALTVTHNGSNYPAIFEFFEFPSGTTVAAIQAQTGVNNGTSGPVASPGAGTWTYLGLAAQTDVSGYTYSFTWDTGTEQTDYSTTNLSGTDGYNFSSVATFDSAATSMSFAATSTLAPTSQERLVVALAVAGGGTTPPPATTLAQRISAAVQRIAQEIKTRGMPAGGVAGQVLTKSSGTDYAAAWATPPGGTGGGTTTPTTTTLTGISGSGSFAVPATFAIMAVSFSAPCRFRMYTTAAGRDADAPRSTVTPYPGGRKRVYEYVAKSTESDEAEPFLVTRDPGATDLFYQVDGTSTVTLTLKEI